jgi:predicted Zn finger-like uncharacterized protein
MSAVLDMAAEIGDLDREGAYASDSNSMILTCPDCATRYFVADDRIGPQGRTVRCASCGTKWTATAEPPLELASSPELGATDFDPFDPTSPDDAPTAELSDLPGEELPKAFRERAQTREKMREAATQGAVWAGLVGVLAVLIGLAVVMRQDVARLWPRTAGAYAMVGLPVNLVGLAIENQHAQPALRDGHAALVVTGSLRNIRDRAIAAPPLRISLLNPAGKAVAVKIADPGGARIPPGEARRFSVDLLDPPVSATDVEIAFDQARPRRSPAGQPVVKTTLRGLTGVGAEAAPLTEIAPTDEGGGANAAQPPAPAPPTTTPAATHG